MTFKLKSDFKPTGDQPQAIKALFKSIESGNTHQTLLGVTGSGKTFTLANVIQKLQRPTLVISHNKTLAGQLYQEFRDFFPENAVSYFVSYYDYYQPEAYNPGTDTYIEKETEVNDEIDKLRLSATANLLSRPDVIVVASVSCIYNLGSPELFGQHFIELMPGMKIDPSSLSRAFIDIQYARSDFELRRGSFRVTGDTITIWPADMDHCLKLEFLENMLETITPINAVSGIPIKAATGQVTNFDHTPRYVVYPAKHYLTDQKNQDQIFQQIKLDLAQRLQELKNEGKIVESYRLGQRVKHDLEMIREIGYVNGIENYSRYFDGRKPGEPPYTLLDYFHYNANKFDSHSAIQPSNHSFLTIIDESHMTIPQLNGMYTGDQSRKQTLIDYGFRLPSAIDNRPLKFTEIQAKLHQTIYVSATPSPWELQQSDDHVFQQLIRPTGLTDPPVEIRPIHHQIPDLVSEIYIRFKKGQRSLVTTLTKRTAEALTEFLNDRDKVTKLLQNSTEKITDLPQVQYLHADVLTLDRQDILDNLRAGKFDVVVGINLLREGLDLPEVSLVAILDADKEGFLRSKTSLIQTMGRAARHVDGTVIMYADAITPSMRSAIGEVKRRRRVQLEYNQTHGLTPQSIQKPIRAKLLKRTPKEKPTKLNLPNQLASTGWQTLADIDPDQLTPKDRQALLKHLKKLMQQAAKDWDFEQAAKYRDTLNRLNAI